MLIALTEQTQQIVTRDARNVAIKLGHTYVGTEHLLLALIENNDNSAVDAIKLFKLDLDKLHTEVETVLKENPPPDSPTGDTRFSRQGLRVVECAREEAHTMGHSYVGTEHILLGLIREGEGIAYRVMNKHGITLTRARKEVWHVLNAPKLSTTESIPQNVHSSITEDAGARIPEQKTSAIHPDVREILINEQQIDKRVKDLAKIISKDYVGKPLLLISVLKGSILFLADLIRQISIPCRFDLMTVSSYGGTTESSGKVKLVMDLKQEVKGKDVIIVEDIFDTGRTLQYIIAHIQEREPNSIKTCVLLSKNRKHENEVKLDYVGFDIPDEFVVGFGLDYQEYYRQLPYVAILKPEIYADKN